LSDLNFYDLSGFGEKKKVMDKANSFDFYFTSKKLKKKNHNNIIQNDGTK